eukprot:4925382-Amphidinium_carterae.1
MNASLAKPYTSERSHPINSKAKPSIDRCRPAFTFSTAWTWGDYAACPFCRLQFLSSAHCDKMHS